MKKKKKPAVKSIEGWTGMFVDYPFNKCNSCGELIKGVLYYKYDPISSKHVYSCGECLVEKASKT